MYVIGETSVAIQIKKNLFNQKFPSRLNAEKKHNMRGAFSDNRLAQLTQERAEEMSLKFRKARKSMTAMHTAHIDHSVWMDVPLFATIGVSDRANQFYRNTIHQSLAQLKKNNPEDEDVAEIIDFYEESNVTLCLLVNVIQALMHSVMFGWAIGVLNIPQKKMMAEFDVSDKEFAWLNAVFALGCVPGALIGGALSDRWGRKQVLLFNDIVWVACGVVFYMIIDYKAYCVFRFVIGMAAGTASVVVPTFLGEISPVRVRGAMGTSVQMCICIGILASQFIAKWVEWRMVIALGSTLALFQLFTAWTFFESPAWLILKDLDNDAEVILKELRQSKNVDFELRMLRGGVEKRDGTLSFAYDGTIEIMESVIFNLVTYANANMDDGGLDKPLLAFSPQAPTFRQKLTKRAELKWALIISIVLLVNQQFSGINSVFFYSASVFRDAGIDAWLGTVLASSANVFGVVLAMGLVENLGRKMCLILSGSFMIAASAGTILGLNRDANGDAEFWQWFTIGALMVYVIGFELGFGPIPWTIATELTPSSDLATVQAIAAALNGVANFIIALVFPYMQKSMQAWVYLPFIIVIALTMLFVQTFVPETKGLRVDQVCQILRGEKTEEQIRGTSSKSKSDSPPPTTRIPGSVSLSTTSRH